MSYRVKSDRERETLYDITYIWNLKRNDINEFIDKKKKNRLTDLENRLMVIRGESWGEGIVWEFEIDTYKPRSLK